MRTSVESRDTSAERYLLDPGLRLLLARPRHLRHERSAPRRLAGDILTRDQPRLPAADYYALWQALGEESGDPNLPIRVGQAISVESFSPPIFAALCSPNLAVAARRIATYKKLIGPMRLSVSSAETEIALRFDWRSQATPPEVLASSSWSSGSRSPASGTARSCGHFAPPAPGRRPTRRQLPRVPRLRNRSSREADDRLRCCRRFPPLPHRQRADVGLLRARAPPPARRARPRLLDLRSRPRSTRGATSHWFLRR